MQVCSLVQGHLRARTAVSIETHLSAKIIDSGRPSIGDRLLKLMQSKRVMSRLVSSGTIVGWSPIISVSPGSCGGGAIPRDTLGLESAPKIT
jgi:hypothetical protein